MIFGRRRNVMSAIIDAALKVLGVIEFIVRLKEPERPNPAQYALPVGGAVAGGGLGYVLGASIGIAGAFGAVSGAIPLAIAGLLIGGLLGETIRLHVF